MSLTVFWWTVHRARHRPLEVWLQLWGKGYLGLRAAGFPWMGASCRLFSLSQASPRAGSELCPHAASGHS